MTTNRQERMFRTCPECRGTGFLVCDSCHGMGWVGIDPENSCICGFCGGRGKGSCPSCGGTVKVPRA